MTQMIKDFANRTAQKVNTLLWDEEGATAAEYGLIAALIAVAIIGAVTLLGGKLKTTFTNISSRLPNGN